jgi:hexulose-6-phosphate isomerase
MSGLERIGFMQGRLSPLVGGRIQAFPWLHWRAEFPVAQSLGLGLMEWTMDHDRFRENPLMTESGRREITELARQHGVLPVSLTGDIFMQAPFWHSRGAERAARLAELDEVLDACAAARIEIVVVPLVDAGAMQDSGHEQLVVDAFGSRAERMRRDGLVVAFECDYGPQELARFIGRLPADCFGINYDIGNSAALGYDCGEEVSAYGSRIRNVHVKDRLLGGTTVPLGSGNADLPRALALLRESGFAGRFILQTARAVDGDHAGAIARYAAMTAGWLKTPYA